MALGRTLGIVVALAGVAASGCVDRRFVIESNIPNAEVFIDNKKIGAAPAYTHFEYYGHHTVTLVHPGYETLTQRVHVKAPWYAYPPFDFFAEVIWPFHIRDTRRYYFELHEAPQPRIEDLLNNAENLRLQGWNLPQAEQPAEPKPRPNQQPPVELLPPAQPVPDPVVPPVSPAPGPGLVPSVRP